MAADQERADRIRALKDDNPQIKWRMVAAHVGVTERAAQLWAKGGGIDYENAVKLAELFPDVTVDWIWSGSKTEPANLTARRTANQEQMLRVEQTQLEIARSLNGLREDVSRLVALLSHVVPIQSQDHEATVGLEVRQEDRRKRDSATDIPSTGDRRRAG